VRHLPVIDEKERVIGLVSQRDLLASYWREGSTSPVPVGPVMKTGLLLVTAETPIQEAIALMIEHRHGCLPVVDGQGKLVGILTETDFLRYVYREVAGVDYVGTWERQETKL
jgi:CBS domain-containing membrane protein